MIFRWMFPFFFISTLLVGCASTPNSDLVYKYDLANKYYAKGLHSDAERLLLEIARRTPDNYDVLFKLGNIYVRTGQFEAAERVYERCIEIDPNEPKGWYNLSLLRVKQAIYLAEEGRVKSTNRAPEFVPHFERLAAGLMDAVGPGTQE